MPFCSSSGCEMAGQRCGLAWYSVSQRFESASNQHTPHAHGCVVAWEVDGQLTPVRAQGVVLTHQAHARVGSASRVTSQCTWLRQVCSVQAPGPKTLRGRVLCMPA